MSKTITIKLEGDLYTWLNGMVGTHRGETLEEVTNSVLETARGRMTALSNYRKKDAKGKKGKGKKAASAKKAPIKKAAKKAQKAAKAPKAPKAAKPAASSSEPASASASA